MSETTTKVCEVAGCDRPVRSQGRCGRCYIRKLRADHAGKVLADPNYNAPPPEPTVQISVKVPASVHDQLKRSGGRPSTTAREVLTAWAARPDLFTNLAMIATKVEE